MNTALSQFLRVMLFSTLSMPFAAFSQTPCATMENHREHLQSNPALEASYEQSQRAILQAQQAGYKTNSNVTTIPVVVHVVHNGQPVGVDENITVEQIMSQFEILNRDFRRQNPDTINLPAAFAGLGGDAEVEFCLAKFDPTGYPTNGIYRYDYGRASWDRPEIESTLKPQTIWDRDKYLNIWIVRFGGDLANRYVQGYAQFPGMAANTDGLVISYRAFGTTGNISPSQVSGRTTVHEVGHWLGLFHIWGDDSDDPVQNQCLGDDQVQDTPNQQTEYYQCPSWPQASCGSQDMYMNYMDYTDGTCQNIFSKGQVARMQATLTTTRSSILNAATLCDYNTDVILTEIAFPPHLDTICSQSFSPVIMVGNFAANNITSFEMYTTINGGAPTQVSWTGNLQPGDTLPVVLDPITLGDGAYSINITLGDINGEGSDQFPGNDFKTNSFWIVNSGNGTGIPYSKGFENGIPGSWTIENPDSDVSWESANVGGFGQSSKSVRIDNFTQTGGGTIGHIDGLWLEPIDLSDGAWQQMTFDIAYARRDANSDDSLFVYGSSNCGDEWELLWANGGQAMATSADYTFPFTPAGTDWQQHIVDLNRYRGNSQVWLRFEHKSDGGNNVYLDNINISKAVTGFTVPEDRAPLQVYPNPASTSLHISGLENFNEGNFILFNYLGQVVQTGKLNNVILLEDNLNSGNYILRLRTEEFTQSEIIQINQ